MRSRRRGRTLLSPPVLVMAVVLFSLIIVALMVRPEPSRPLRPIILTSSEWRPYASDALPGQGPVVRVVNDVWRAAGYAPQVEFTSWTAAQQRVLSGEALGTFPFVESSTRAENYLVSDQITTFTYVLFVRTDGPVIDDAADLGTLRIGAVAGYEYWPELDAAVGEYVEFATSGEALRALAAGEVDVVPEGRLVGEELLRSPGLGIDAALVEVLPGDEPWQSNTRGLHLLMARSRANEALLAAFNEQLAEYLKSDAYRDAMTQLGSATDEVLLTSDDGSVWLYDEAGGQVSRTPNGTRAVVLAWPESLTAGAPDSELVEVRVLNGPLAGRHLFVELADLELSA